MTKVQRAWEFFDQGAYEESERLYEECLASATTEAQEEAVFGLIYVKSAMKKYSEARAYAKRLLEAAKGPEARHIALHQSGMVERMAGALDQAQALFQEEAMLIQEAFPEDALRKAVNLYEQAIVHLGKSENAFALERMTSSLEAALSSGDAMTIGCSYRGMGEILSAQGDKVLAESQFRQAVIHFQKAGDSMAVSEAEALLAGLAQENAYTNTK